jgi:hypothetical protein
MLLPYMAGFLGNYLEKYIHLGVAVSMFTAFSFAYTNNIPDYIYVVWTGLAAFGFTTTMTFSASRLTSGTGWREGTAMRLFCF